VNDRPNDIPAGWFPDPLGRYDHRWYNGSSWTADVSVNGARFVDPLPLAGPTGPAVAVPMGSVPGMTYQGVGVPGPRPTRTMAVLSLIAGLVSVTTGWMPIFFVVGGAAGIAAIVLGVIARNRAREGRATGGGMATAGLVLGPIGLASCVVGVMLTGVVLREVREYTEIGPYDVEITSCVAEAGSVRISGTIENLDQDEHDYSIVLEALDGRDVLERDDITVEAVEPGELREWERLMLTGSTPDAPECEVFSVNGPFPFGLDPNP
jgi:hypothetical protein